VRRNSWKRKTVFDSLWLVMEENNIPFKHVYKADQTGLFLNKLPYKIYFDREAKDYCGVKQVKS
jgi:hypothetical protein